MKIYNVYGYLIILCYLLACMYFAPHHLGPWVGTVDRRESILFFAGFLRGCIWRMFCIWASRIARSTTRNGSSRAVTVVNNTVGHLCRSDRLGEPPPTASQELRS